MVLMLHHLHGTDCRQLAATAAVPPFSPWWGQTLLAFTIIMSNVHVLDLMLNMPGQ